MKCLYILFVSSSFVGFAMCNKYSQEANLDVLHLKDPFRMGKINMLWEKAKKRLSVPKLKKLLSELKMQDKEELTLKKLKSSGGDKEGAKEAELRKKLLGIVRHYALNDPHELDAVIDEHKIMKAVFKDKKLNSLWLKAEKSGFTQDELKALKEEFQHHQEKVDEYYALLEKMNSRETKDELENNILNYPGVSDMEGSHKEFNENVNEIRQRHRELKQRYDTLHKKATAEPSSQEFEEPKVAGLWKLALRSDFNDEELQSLHRELKHYESRLLKVRHLTNQLQRPSIGKHEHLSDEDRLKILQSGDTEAQAILRDRLAKHSSTVNKLHEDLEARILARHSEL